MYRVLAPFADLQDGSRLYDVGDEFPHKACGYDVSAERFDELSSCKNKLKMPLIEQIEKPRRGRKSADK